jgi:hypothetical protein
VKLDVTSWIARIFPRWGPARQRGAHIEPYGDIVRLQDPAGERVAATDDFGVERRTRAVETIEDLSRLRVESPPAHLPGHVLDEHRRAAAA